MAEQSLDCEIALPACEQEEPTKDTLRKAGQVAIAAALAATLAAGPVHADAYELPRPAPIVYVLEPPTPDEPVAPSADEPEDKTSPWQKLLKILKWALIVLLLAGTCVLGALKGCSALGLAPLAPVAAASSSSSSAL